MKLLIAGGGYRGFLARVLSMGLLVWEIADYIFDFVIYFIIV
jgi:hypothetical protein